MENAELYASSNALAKRDAATVLNEFVPLMKWSDDELILDVGSGSGDVTHNQLLPVCPKYVRVVGIDSSQKMVDYAREHFQNERLSFVKMDIVGEKQPVLEFPQRFTKIFSFYCLHWIQNQNKAVSNLYELLRPGGTCYLFFVAHHPIFEVYGRIAKNKKWAPFMTDWQQFNPVHQNSTDAATDFRLTLENCGFHVLKCDAPDLVYVYKNLKYFYDLVKSLNPFVHRMPEEVQNEYMLDWLREMQLKLPLVDGKMVLKYKAIVALAQKLSLRVVTPSSDEEGISIFITPITSSPKRVNAIYPFLQWLGEKEYYTRTVERV